MIQKCKDGTIKYRNPFSGTECWYTPGRRHRPGQHDRHEAQPLLLHDPQDYCSFCPAHYAQTTPEKGRMVVQQGSWVLRENLNAEQIVAEAAEFRRIGNLFEIISLDYWKENYGFRLSPLQARRLEIYLSTEAGREHVQAMLHHRHRRKHDVNDLEKTAEGFFGGAHDLMIPRQHFRDDAVNDAQLFSTGEMTPEAHEQFFQLTLHTLKEFYQENPFIRFVAVYTNWRRDAGATFAHLHRQVIGLDRWGETVQRCVDEVKRNAHCFSEHLDMLSGRLRLAVCENDEAVAVVDIGQPFSTIAVFCRRNGAPHKLEAAQTRGVSDLVHAIHAALGAQEPCNEEWYYAPRDSVCPFPWFVLIKWRKNRHAGFEGITGIFIDVYRPEEVRDLLVERLQKLRSEGRIAAMRIGEECGQRQELNRV